MRHRPLVTGVLSALLTVAMLAPVNADIAVSATTPQYVDHSADTASLHQSGIGRLQISNRSGIGSDAEQKQVVPPVRPPVPPHRKTASKLSNADLILGKLTPPLLNSADLLRKFAAAETRLEDVRQGSAHVPPIFLASLPSDMATLSSAKTRKRVFIKAVLPLVLRVNRTIARQRELLIYLRQASAEGRPLSSFDRQFLDAIAERYGTTSDDWAEMLRRVDIVPPSLALAQAAEESGWGTSRFARHGNAVFGQRTFRPGTGMVPKERDADDSYEVRRFDTLYSSIEAYVRNLNTHPTYETFRSARAALRQLDGGIDSLRLAGALEGYSERGSAYADNIRRIIRGNRLHQFDRARLADHEEAALRLWRGEQPS